MRFAGKVAIVTGSSNGIGRETARQFAKEGAMVTICGRNATALKETKDICLAENGNDESKILELIGDIIQEETTKEIVEKTVAKWGKIDILVNNAGGGATLNPQELEGDLCHLDYALDLNLKCIMRLCQLAYPHLQKTKGEIINISSIAGLEFAVPHFPFYSISKSALDQLTRSMAAHYIQKGVRVNGVNPGVVSTKIIQRAGLSDEAVHKIELNIASETRRIPMGRPGTSEEIANVILFLADRPQSAYIVGHMLRVDGGTSLHNPFLAEGYMQFAE